MLSTQRCSVNATWWLTGSRKYFHFEKNIFGETAEAGARLQPECAGNEESLIQSVDNALRNLTLMEWTKEDSHGKIWSQESLFFCVYLKWISFCICLKTHKEKTISGKKKNKIQSQSVWVQVDHAHELHAFVPHRRWVPVSPSGAREN